MKFLNLEKTYNKYLKQVFSISTDKVVEPSSFLGISKVLWKIEFLNLKIIKKSMFQQLDLPM